MTETLLTCSNCKQTGFTARGLTAHQKTKACKERAELLQADLGAELINLNTSHLPGHVARFQLFHGLVCKSALEMKLAKYFAGLEVNALYDLHEELHGETRGGDVKSDEAKIKTEGASVLKLEDFLEQHLNVTARTARKYRGHFLSITDAAPEVAKKLNETWKSLSATEPKALPAPGDLTTFQPATLLEESGIKAIIEHADEWGLHELFQAPERDITPPTTEDDEDDDANKKAKKAAIIKFWGESLVRRFDQDEFLRLPPATLEAVTCKMEEAAKKAREVLAAKAAAKNKKKTK